MDYSLFHIRRIADSLCEIGVTVPGGDRHSPSTAEPVPQETEVTTSKSTKSNIYLPRWLNDHRYDPAAMVT